MKPRLALVSVALCAICYTSAPAIAQTKLRPPASTRPANSFEEVERKMHLPRPDLQQVQSAELTAILNHPEQIIPSITDPKTPYLLRRAAAAQGAAVIPIEQLPKLLTLIDEYEAEELQHHWGMQLHPMSATMATPIPPGIDHNRTIFGRPWKLPDAQSDFPLTWDEEAAAPWPWQAGQALGDLFRFMVSSSSGNIDAQRHWIDVAMTMPCNNDVEATRFAKATIVMRRNYTLAEIGRWRQIAGNPAMPGAAYQIASTVANAAKGWDDPRSRPFAQLVLLAAMKNDAGRARGDAAYTLREMREAFYIEDRRHRLFVPATSVLAAAALALDPKAGDDWSRYYLFASSVCEAVDDPPFKPDRNMSPASPQVQQHLKEFATWLEKAKPALEEKAAAEKPALDQLRKESDEAAAKFPAVKGSPEAPVTRMRN